MNLKSDTIDLRIVNDSLNRAISWGKSRSRAVSANQSILADSIDVLMPGQRLRVMHAVGDALAVFGTTGLDVLVLEDTVIEKRAAPTA